MKKLVLIFFLFINSSIFSQSINSFYQTIIANSSNDTILHHLQSFQNFGVKKIPSAALNNTANWIIGKYQSFGYNNIVRDTFSYSGNELYNIVVTKTGTVFPNVFLVISSHYDTYNSIIQHSPGANDNGSGVVAMLEIARLISGINTAYSIKFITFSAEEVGMAGSTHYVSDEVNSENMDIKLVFNIDEVGGQNGVNNTTVKCERDESAPTTNNAVSSNYTDTLSNLTELYTTLLTEITNAYGSDYMPFQSNNEIITGFYEDPASSHYHKTTDIVANMNLPYFFQVTKAAIAASLYFSKAYQVFTSDEFLSTNSTIKVFPNPVTDNLKIEGLPEGEFMISVCDMMGKTILRSELTYSDKLLDTKPLVNGVYYYNINDLAGKSVKSGKLIKVK